MLTEEQEVDYEIENDTMPPAVERAEGKYGVILVGLYSTTWFYYLTLEDAKKRYDFTLKYDDGGKTNYGYVGLLEIIQQETMSADPVSTHMNFS